MNYPDLNEILTAEKPEIKPELNGADQSDFDQAIEFFQTTPQTTAPLSPQMDDFDAPPPIPTAPEIKTEESKPRLDESEYRFNAELTVGLLDGTQNLLLPVLYQNRLYTKEEKELLKELKAKQKVLSGISDYSEAEIKLLDKYMTIEELKKDVPFLEKEKEMLIEPLAKIYSKYNIQIGPEYTLLGAIAMIMTPRIMPFFSGIERNF